MVFHGAFAPDRETRFRVTAKGIGHVLVKWQAEAPEWFPKGQVFYQERKYRIGEWITCPAKEIAVDVVLGTAQGFPVFMWKGKSFVLEKTGLFRTS